MAVADGCRILVCSDFDALNYAFRGDAPVLRAVGSRFATSASGLSALTFNPNQALRGRVLWLGEGLDTEAVFKASLVRGRWCQGWLAARKGGPRLGPTYGTTE